MSFPTRIEKTTPEDSANPSAGAGQIRNLKGFVEDILGITDAATYTAAAMSVSTAGKITLVQDILLTGARVNFGSTTGDSGYGIRDNSGTIEIKHSGGSWIESSVPRGYLFGMTLSNGSIDPYNDIDIAAGECASSDALAADRALLSPGAMTKRLDATWSAGTNQGGRSSSVALGNTTYHVFAIRVGTTDDIGFDTNVTANNLVADHDVTHYRRIGSITRTFGYIPGFLQVGDRFTLELPVLDVQVTAPGTSAAYRTLSVAAGVKVLAIVSVSLTGHATAVNRALLTDPDQDDANPTSIGGQVLTAAGAASRDESVCYVYTDTLGRIRSRCVASDGGVILYITTHGWIDTRGRLA